VPINFQRLFVANLAERFSTAKPLIRLAVHALALKFLSQYEADAGALTKAQLAQVKKSAPKAQGECRITQA
jgi:hypothetical protein